jgi:hypothetical protein
MPANQPERDRGVGAWHSWCGSSDRRPAVAWIIWILPVAALLRGLAWLRTDPVAFDSAVYFEMAERIWAGRWTEALSYPYPPLFPALIGGLQRLGCSAETAGLLIALSADLLVLFPLVAIARSAAGTRAAWGAAFLWAIHPLAILLGVQALTDAPTALFVSLAVLAGIRALEDGRRLYALGAGAASGVAYLFRPEGIEPALGLAVLYLYQFGTVTRREAGGLTVPSSHGPGAVTHGSGGLRWLWWAGVPLTGWALIALPYVAYISVEAGSLTLSKKKSISALMRSLGAPSGGEHRQPVQEMSILSVLPTVGSAVEVGDRPVVAAAGRPPGWLQRAGRSVYTFQKPLVNGVSPLVLSLAILGIWRLRARRGSGDTRACALLAGLLALHLALLLGLAAQYGPAYLGSHHFFLVAVYALPFAGAGMSWVLGWGSSGKRPAGRWLSAVVIVGLVAGTGGWVVRRQAGRGVAVRPAAAWVQTQVAGTPVVVTNVAKLTYHAGAERVELVGTYDDILREGRARGAHFVAFYPDLVSDVSPDLLARLDAADLELVKTFPEPFPSAPDQRLEVYRVRPR